MSNKIAVKLWNRDFELSFGYQNYPGESVTQIQEETVNRLTSADFEAARIAVEQYIYKHNREDLGEESITNLFKYVMPKRILIARDPEKRVFAIMCNYKFDIEHGLAIVFVNEQFNAVGLQDIIL